MPVRVPPGPFGTAAARKADLTKKTLRGRRVQSLGHGLYAAADTPIGLLKRTAAVLIVMPPDSVVTGVTMLHLYGVEVGDPLPIHVVTTTGTQTRRREVRLTRVTALPARTGRRATPAAAWLAACVGFDLLQAVAAADWLMHRGLVTRAALVIAAAEAEGRGCRLARRAAELSCERVESPQETRLRLCLVLAGLPTPECNVTLGDDIYVIGRVDLLLEAYKLILEYDGDQHRTDRRQWNLDLDRDDAFDDLGYLTIRVTSARMRRPRDLVRRVFARLVEYGYNGPEPTFSPEWCALFETPTR
ncbi:MAG TPA: DUF559 domain-containing protein [Propionibacteriaceae bacterium]